MQCRVCKHRFYEGEQRSRRNCPLCHSPLQMSVHQGGGASELDMELRRGHGLGRASYGDA